MNKYEQNAHRPNDKKEKFVRTNYKIRNQYCRVIEDGKAQQIMKTSEAIAYAESLGLDLVEIGYDKANACSNCKVLDYSKFMYEQKKREKMAKKQARANAAELKSLQFSLTTDEGDKSRIISHAKEFLAIGDKVKLAIRFRNRREMANINMAKDLMKAILGNFDGLAVLDSSPSLSGKELACILRKA